MINSSFLWDDFYNRYVNNKEEFHFIYNNKEIDLSYALSKTNQLIVALSYGNDKDGFLWKDYSSPEMLLNDTIFDGKTLKEIWNELS